MDTRFKYLLDSHYSGTLTPSEKQELLDIIHNEDQELLINAVAEHLTEKKVVSVNLSIDEAWAAVRNIVSLDRANSDGNPVAHHPLIADLQSADSTPAHRIHFLKTAWFRYAVAIVIIFGIGTYLLTTHQKKKPETAQTYTLPVQNDVLPGGNKAILTLADGSTIILDSAVNGTLTQQGAATVVKSSNGEIIYSLGSSLLSQPVLYNTMSTPRGGQYQLVLPDGSRVWLNAASSIIYPTDFKGKERRVSITGEAYFEVAKDKSKPFIVKFRESELNVLGTAFNIKAYLNEPSIKITLIEGSVKLKNIVLKPGEASMDGKLIKADVEQDLAWKNGLFNFKDADLPTVMRQLERWYDIEVVYEESPGKYKFQGELQRKLNLSQVIRILGEMDIKFKIEGRRLIVIQ